MQTPAAGDCLEFASCDPLSSAEWDALAATHRDFSIFHSSAWARVLALTYGHKPYYLRCLRGSEVVALLPFMEVNSRVTGRRGVSLPFSDFCSPLAYGKVDSQALLHGLHGLATQRRWDHFEVRGGGDSLFRDAPPSSAFYAHTLELSVGIDLLFAGCRSSVRQAVRKAERSGVTVVISSERRAMLEYYRLHVRTRRRHGLPPQPLAFFLQIYEELIRHGHGFISLASSSGTIVAGAVFLLEGQKAVYKFGASDERSQAVRPSNLVMWKSIEFLSGGGVSSLHFGRTSLGNESLRRFKLGWGAQEERLEYFQYHTATAAWTTRRDKTSGFHNRIFSSLPLALNRAIGGLLYPHLD